MLAVKKVLSPEQEKIEARRAELKAELEKLGEVNTQGITFKINTFTNKKQETQVNIMVHGLTPKPMPLYGSQALRFVAVAEQLKAFVEENRAALSWKE